MLTHVENGFDEMINTWTTKFKQLKLNENAYFKDDLITALVSNPSLIRLPIIIDKRKLEIGFNEREIRSFLSK